MENVVDLEHILWILLISLNLLHQIEKVVSTP